MIARSLCTCARVDRYEDRRKAPLWHGVWISCLIDTLDWNRQRYQPYGEEKFLSVFALAADHIGLHEQARAASLHAEGGSTRG
jgi:hypothetical protein